jgi:hypothetical protein
MWCLIILSVNQNGLTMLGMMTLWIIVKFLATDERYICRLLNNFLKLSKVNSKYKNKGTYNCEQSYGSMWMKILKIFYASGKDLSFFSRLPNLPHILHKSNACWWPAVPTAAHSMVSMFFFIFFPFLWFLFDLPSY